MTCAHTQHHTQADLGLWLTACFRITLESCSAYDGSRWGGLLTLVNKKKTIHARVVLRQALGLELNLMMYWNTAVTKANTQELPKIMKTTGGAISHWNPGRSQ